MAILLAIQKILRIYLIVLLGLLGSPVLGGLIIDVSSDIDVSSIEAVVMEGGDLVVLQSRSKRHVIKLPRYALENIIVWARQDCSSPYVISVDGALVPGGSSYVAPCIPPGLRSIMFDFDVYAHNLGRGYTPSRGTHPLIAETGDAARMPDRQYEILLDLNNEAPEAIWYRRLTKKYISSTIGVGEFTIKVIPSENGFPVKVIPRSRRWIRPQRWDRKKSVPNPWDRRTLDLPFRYLKADIESRWDEYRKVFPAMDDLSSIVEAYALLNALKEQKPAIWNTFIQDSENYLGRPFQLREVIFNDTPSLDYTYFAAEPSWEDISLTNLDNGILTHQEAELALAFLWEGYGDYYYTTGQWLKDIEEKAKNYPALQAKLLLYQGVKALEQFEDFVSYDDPDVDQAREKFLADSEKFFNYVRRFPELMRIRVMGYHKLLNTLYYSQGLSTDFQDHISEILEQEKLKIIRDFIQCVDEKKNLSDEGANDHLVWEDLSQTVYSVGLLDLATDWNGLNTEFSERLAYVHYMRGKTYQKGLELAYCHAHFRFLKYLQSNLEDDHLYEAIDKFRSELAKKMGITGWRQEVMDDIYSEYEQINDEWEQMAWEELESEVEEQIEEEIPSDGAYAIIEGQLVTAYQIIMGERSTSDALKALRQGAPGGIIDMKDNFTLLLIDGRVLAEAARIKGSRESLHLKVVGLTHDEERAMTPLSVFYRNNNKWEKLELPFDGIINLYPLTEN